MEYEHPPPSRSRAAPPAPAAPPLSDGARAGPARLPVLSRARQSFIKGTGSPLDRRLVAFLAKFKTLILLLPKVKLFATPGPCSSRRRLRLDLGCPSRPASWSCCSSTRSGT